jgi:hypothetical protein
MTGGRIAFKEIANFFQFCGQPSVTRFIPEPGD